LREEVVLIVGTLDYHIYASMGPATKVPSTALIPGTKCYHNNAEQEHSPYRWDRRLTREIVSKKKISLNTTYALLVPQKNAQQPVYHEKGIFVERPHRAFLIKRS